MTDERRQRWEAQLVAAYDGDGQSSAMGTICGLCVAELPISGAGATVLSNIGDGDGDGDGDGHATRRGLVHATNDVSERLEDLQLTVGEGPCLDTFTTGGPVLIPDLSEVPRRWPAFTKEALKLGAAALFSFPLRFGVVRLGSLDFYRETPGSLSTHQVSDALVLADLATKVVIQELEGHRAGDLTWLANPHAEVHQATGMIQAQLDTTTETALLRLRAHAYTHELTISEVARKIVARELRLTPEQ